MQVIVAGCGRVGSSLAKTLDADGHDVAVIDIDPHAFRRLGKDFGGSPVQGIVFDRGTLLTAGVESTQAFVAVTSGDNSNIVAARTAKQHFGITTVVARIYDPERALIYERYGITTIASARWTSDTILGHLVDDGTRIDSTIGPGEGDVVVLSHDLPNSAGPWVVESFERQGHWVLAAVTRTGQTTVPVPRQLVQAGERVHLAVQRSALDQAEDFLNQLATSPARDRS